MEEDQLDLYDFDLPEGSIAQRPSEKRDASRLLVLCGSDEPQHLSFADLPDLLQSGDLLVRNDTRVIPARLMGKRSGGGKTEVLLVHHESGEGDFDGERWLCLARPASHLKPGKVVTFGDGKLECVIEEKRGQGRVLVSFRWDGDEPFSQVLEQLGQVPLPPYIERENKTPDSYDRERYQTTFANTGCAVAAPTAGLHFTPEIDKALADKGIDIAHVTLHVGPGTFRPIKVDNLSEHTMDSEYYTVSEEVAAKITEAKKSGRRVIGVGTTSTRTLESVTDENGVAHAGSGWTELFIRPGYKFKAIDGLLTNFHLPRSSLIVLVSAFAGRERVLSAYREAIASGYRFYSYGDATLFLP